MRRKLYAVVLAGILMTGCATRGTQAIAEETQETVATKIVEGKSTKEDVRKVYGAPTTVSGGSSGDTWIYSFSQSKQDPKAYIPFAGVFLAKDKMKANTLSISFDKKGVVKNYQFISQNTTSTRY